MAIVEMKVPSPGESVTEVQISRWIKKSGDYVEKDDELCEIDSDKATPVKLFILKNGNLINPATVVRIASGAP